LNLFLLILKEELRNERNASEQHCFCLLRGRWFAGCRKLGTAERDEAGTARRTLNTRTKRFAALPQPRTPEALQPGSLSIA
jgi:hypothetical protein